MHPRPGSELGDLALVRVLLPQTLRATRGATPLTWRTATSFWPRPLQGSRAFTVRPLRPSFLPALPPSFVSFWASRPQLPTGSRTPGIGAHLG